MNKPANITKNDWLLLLEKYSNIEEVIELINNNYPIQYLIGYVNFYGYKILVDENVLIPRFETETLVEKTINLLHEYHFEQASTLEIGTGSGCISIALKKEIPSLDITAIDISLSSLKIAKKNCEENQADIELLENDLYEYHPKKKYDFLISNPPYVAIEEEVDPKIKYEPQNAIYAKNHGLAYYEYIIQNAFLFVKNKFIMSFEIGEKQGKYLSKLAQKKFPNATIKIEKDLACKVRYLFIINV